VSSKKWHNFADVNTQHFTTMRRAFIRVHTSTKALKLKKTILIYVCVYKYFAQFNQCFIVIVIRCFSCSCFVILYFNFLYVCGETCIIYIISEKCISQMLHSVVMKWIETTFTKWKSNKYRFIIDLPKDEIPYVHMMAIKHDIVLNSKFFLHFII